MRVLSASVATLIAAGPCLAAFAPAPADPATGLRALADDYWSAYVARYPEIATYQGVTAAPHDRLTDSSLAAVVAWQAREDAWLARLHELAKHLDPASGEAVVAGVLDDTLRSAVATRVCRTEPRSTAAAVHRQVEALLATAAADSPLLEPARRDGDPAFAAALAAVVRDEIRLRAEAQRRLGARFDIRAFHDRVLEDGALPMPALALKIERWIASLGRQTKIER